MFFYRFCKIRHLFSLENPFMSRFVLSVTVIEFPYGYNIISFIFIIVRYRTCMLKARTWSVWGPASALP